MAKFGMDTVKWSETMIRGYKAALVQMTARKCVPKGNKVLVARDTMGSKGNEDNVN